MGDRRMTAVMTGRCVLAVLALALQGCATLADPERLRQESRIDGVMDYPRVHAALQRGADGRWVFRELDAAKGAVRLNDMWVELPDPVAAQRGLLGLVSTARIDDLQARRLQKELSAFSVSPTTAVTTPLSALLLLGLPLVMVSDGAYSAASQIFPVYGRYQPSQRAYRRALAQARQVDAYDQRFAPLLARWAALRSRSGNLEADVLALKQETYAGSLQALADWRQRIVTAAAGQLEVKVVNASGWPDPFAAEAGLRSGLRLDVAGPAWNPPVVEFADAGGAILPARDLDAFEANIAAAEAAFPSAAADVAAQLRDYIAYRGAYALALRRADADVTVADEALRAKLADWVHAIDAPGSLPLREGRLARTYCYCVTLHARVFREVLPVSFHVEDAILSATWTVAGIELVNRGTGHVSLDGATVYYQSRTDALEVAALASARDVAPGARVVLPSPLQARDAAQMTLTRSAATGRTLPFGLALRYRLPGDAAPRVLERREALPLLPMLQARL